MPGEVLLSYQFRGATYNGLQIKRINESGLYSGALKAFRNSLKAQSLHRLPASRCKTDRRKNARHFTKKEPAPCSSSGTGSCACLSHRNVTSENVQRFRPWRLEAFGVAGAGAAAAACGWVAALTSGLLSHLGAQQLVFMVIVVGLVDSLIMN